MIAGPNGSGKSTLKNLIRGDLLGIYVNADEIEKELKADGVALDYFGIGLKEDELRAALVSSSRFAGSSIGDEIYISNGRLRFGTKTINSYHAAAIADFFRHKLLKERVSFTFETVMSHESKVDFLRFARNSDCRTYLYYIATDNPQINVARVIARAAQGGHFVSEEKILPRYWRSLKLLPAAIRNSNRAYIFDNSGVGTGQQADNFAVVTGPSWLAEITEGKLLEIKSQPVPAWFKRSVLDELTA